ncbi:MAG: OmpH family outer membrane protein [Bacteroides sp.]|nr:OmpH family outer membrane protein [Bacteroides sp.]
MMKTTTEPNRWVSVAAWAVVLLIFATGAYFLNSLPTPNNEGINLTKADANVKQQQQPRQAITRNAAERLKQEQARRALPANYADQLVKQSEILVRRNLNKELNRFREMAVKMRSRKNHLLTKVEGRKLPASAPSDANDTSQARAIAQVRHTVTDASPIKDIYEQLRAYETEILQNHLAVSAAKQVLTKGLSFPEVYNALKQGSTRMPTFDELINMQSRGNEWECTAQSNASNGLSVKSTADLNRYRNLLGQTMRQAGLAATRLENLFGKPRQIGRGGTAGSGNSGNSGSAGGGSGVGYGSGEAAGEGGTEGIPIDVPKTPYAVYAGAQLDKEMVQAQALPGRRFAKNAQRKGWLYINTWYMIGPWENYGRDDFAIVHPPEIAIDFDAVYTDGQIGVGKEETDSHPIHMIGEEVQLDGTLRWKFMQSESMHNTVPVTSGHSTYYAYTELYFDEATTMLVAIGTDDSGRVWINGKDVWQDTGTSWYNIDEHIEPFHFDQGWNRILVRLENGGGGPAGFSFLIIPQEG